MSQIVVSNQSDYKKILELFSQIEGQVNELTEDTHPVLNGECFLTDKELSERLKIARRTLHVYRTNGILPYTQIGGKFLYKESDIQAILEKNYQPAFDPIG